MEENNQQYDSEMIEEIVNNIKIVLFANPPVIMSWGIHNIRQKTYENMVSLSFKVQGFKYTGEVIVAYDRGPDLYQVILPGDNPPQTLKRIKDIYWDQLVDIIDTEVETGGNDKEYQEKIGEWIREESKPVIVVAVEQEGM